MERIKTGLIMEGGAMRGLFTAGVIDVFMENNIKFDGAIGVSAGAAFGCNYKSNQIGRAVRYNKKYCNDKRYGSIKSLLKTGDYYNAEFDYITLPEKLDKFDSDSFEKNEMEFYVVCTDADSGEAIYHKLSNGKREDIQWIRASASMPVLSKPVELDGKRMLDGGIADSIPIKWFQKNGYKKNVVILTQPEYYVKKKPGIAPFLHVLLKKYPSLIKKMDDRHIRYNETTKYIHEEELKGNIMVIRPETSLQIGKAEKNPNELERVYQAGRKEGKMRLDAVKHFLK